MLWQAPLPEKYLNMNEADIAAAIAAHRRRFGGQLLILGHHYQQDDVIQHADFTGDSLKLSRLAADETPVRGVRYIVFCGVHFMAETAAMLANDSVQVILPDLSAGCSMANMAEYEDALEAWDLLHRAHGGMGGGWFGRIIPITYINSSAAVKAFVGEHGGACCTSSNAKEILSWALAGGTQPVEPGEQIKIMFLPDQHLGRNTASKMGFLTEVDEQAGRGPSETAVWDPLQDHGGMSDEQIRRAQIYLWAGHCSVHMQFGPQDVDRVRREAEEEASRHQGIKASGTLDASMSRVTVIVHPECRKEVVDKADQNGSTERIIQAVEGAAPGSHWAVGTEVHLVNRLAARAAARGVHVRMLSECQCLCTSMYRIDPPHLLWALDNLAAGKVVNRITVHPEIAAGARLALERMLQPRRSAVVVRG